MIDRWMIGGDMSTVVMKEDVVSPNKVIKQVYLHSKILILKDMVALLPDPSVKVYVTTVVPMVKYTPDV